MTIQTIQPMQRIAGFGCRKNADHTSLQAALTLAQAALATQISHTTFTLNALAIPADKAAIAMPLAEALGLPLLLIDAATLQTQITHTHSTFSQAARNTGSVAEAAALAAAGTHARLLITRCISDNRLATCAIAEGIIS